MTTETDFGLTPDQLAFIRAAAARWRMDEAGPMMLTSLRKAAVALHAVTLLTHPGLIGNELYSLCGDAEESVRAAIAAAE